MTAWTDVSTRAPMDEAVDVHGARVALVSMPWMAPAMPSIQLATLEAALRAEGIAADVHELYVNFAARVGLNVYRSLCRLIGFHAEWLFSRHYFGPERGDWLEQFLDHAPSWGLQSAALESTVLRAFEPVTEEFLEASIDNTDWGRYDVVGFSASLIQLGSTMAMARRLKLRHPELTVVVGGSQCAGPMGAALARICPYVDVVVRVEGELVLPEIVRRVREGRSLEGVAGITWRGEDGVVHSQGGHQLYTGRAARPALRYDAYFERLRAEGIEDMLQAWIPFESSRGCWYGERVQCTFCGLHEIMEFRSWSADLVLEELEELHTRHGIDRFFAVDLIMPREYLKTLLPEIERRNHEWSLFYEVKANRRRADLEQMARSGVTWIQPGIESLDDELLSLMDKGVSVLQNIQLLKWCRELGIRVGWNLITGLPGETSDSYRRMAEIVPHLVHLAPPAGLGNFQLHRFSPYFDDPDRFGITPTGAHPLYRYIFPLIPRDLDDLMYLHDYEVHSSLADPRDVEALRRQIVNWWRSYSRGARLRLVTAADGSATIVDSRREGDPIEYPLSRDELTAYRLLDAVTVADRLLNRIDELPAAEASARRSALDRWIELGLVLRIGDRLLALAVADTPVAARPRLQAPAPYLEELPLASA